MAILKRFRPFSWIMMKAMFYDFPGAEEYKKCTGIDLTEAASVGRKGEGRKPVEGYECPQSPLGLDLSTTPC